MHLKHIFSILASGALLAACGDSTVTNVNDEAKPKGSITIKVVDNHSGAALSDVIIYSVIDDETETSNDLGLYTWSNLSIGDHVFQISKDGYATLQANVSLEEQGKGDVARVGDVVATIPMYKSGVVAKGYVLYSDDKGKVKAASGVKVYASLPKVFVPSEICDTTSEDGEYSFDNLPEGVEVSIYVGQETINSKKYVGSEEKLIGGANYRVGDLINVSNISLSKMTTSIVKISDNTSDIDSTSEVTLTFAAEIDEDSVTSSKWTVANSSGSTVLTTVSLSKDKRTIVIKPYSGKWNNENTYTVKGTVYSTDGSYTSVSTSFTVSAKGVADVPAAVTNLKIDKDPDDPDYVHLSWKDPNEETSRYNIYIRTNLDADFKMSTYTNKTELLIDLTDFSSKITEIEYIVLPVNEDGVEGEIREAKKVSYEISNDV